MHFYTIIIWWNQFFQRKENFCRKYFFNSVANELIGFSNCWRLQKSFETLDFPLRGVHHSNPRNTIGYESILNIDIRYRSREERRLEQHRGGENEFIFKLDSRRIRPRVNGRAKCLWYDWYLRASERGVKYDATAGAPLEGWWGGGRSMVRERETPSPSLSIAPVAHNNSTDNNCNTHTNRFPPV